MELAFERVTRQPELESVDARTIARRVIKSDNKVNRVALVEDLGRCLRIVEPGQVLLPALVLIELLLYVQGRLLLHQVLEQLAGFCPLVVELHDAEVG